MLTDKLSADLKDAMRSKDDVRLRTIRSLRAAITEKEIEMRRGGVSAMTEADELSVLQKQAKQRRDSIEQFQAASREDLARKEEQELAVIEEYLPKQLSDEEIEKEIREIIEETGATSPSDIGKVMGPAMMKLKGRADGKRVQQITRGMLSA